MSSLRVLSIFLPLLPLAASTTHAANAGDTQSERVRFNRDIRPIMSDTCFHCHGFDPKSRKAGLRLDIRDEAIKKTENDIFPIVLGAPEKSAIIERIFTSDRDDLMPPVSAHKALTPAQKETFRRWVAEGAEYEPHWAYAPLQKVQPPTEHGSHPVDGFIRAKLAEKNIKPSAEASKEKLLRRLSLDLIGLPPTPQETAAFLADHSPEAYQRQVDRLLASPHYGERMAVWWLDIARFSDTVGFHGDQNQRIFPYRDYVINAFNANKGFDQFTIEQLAGDLLENPTTEQITATGYNRLNMMTREGGAQAKEYLAKYGAERVRAVSAAWFGSTFGCAECHDHKFDPIKTLDFYELQSFFADVKQWGVYSPYKSSPVPELAGFSNEHPFPPEIAVESPYLRHKKKRLEGERQEYQTALLKSLATNKPTAAGFDTWAKSSQKFLERHPRGWMTPPVAPMLYKDGKAQPDRDAVVDEDQAVQVEKALVKGEELRVTAIPGVGRIAAVSVEALSAHTTKETLEAALGKSLNFSAQIKAANGTLRKVGIFFADATEKGKRYSNGAEVIGVTTGWKLQKSETDKPLQAVMLLNPPQELAAGDKLVLSFSGEAMLPLRVSVSPFAALDPLQIDLAAIRTALAASDDKRSPEQKRLLAETWLLSTAADKLAFERYQQLATQLREVGDAKAWTLVTQAVDPLTVRVLPRGNWQDESGPLVLPSTPSFLPGRIESTEQKRLSRLDLARWIVSKDNPITGRAVINRLWQQFFGVGLSAALDDLGSQGELPSHAELLDWLASEFRDGGWDVKHMIRLMVTSATYRQSSSLRPELRDLDPANRLLASQNPRRLDAEFVRDNALFIAGALNTSDIGGPSVKPYQPEGYYEALQFPNRDYLSSLGEDQWRRGVYMHWQRTFLHPMLAAFDAPARDECAAMRVISNTPQQALTLLNDPTFVEAARLFSARLLSKESAGDEERITRAFELAVARTPETKEVDSLKKFVAAQREYYRSNPADAGKLLKIGHSPASKGDEAELAAWTNLCRVVLNAQETITRY